MQGSDVKSRAPVSYCNYICSVICQYLVHVFIDLDVCGENGDSRNVPLKVGDRVVWISDNLPEQGVVRWLGYLDGHSLKNEMMAGVEFVSSV